MPGVFRSLYCCFSQREPVEFERLPNELLCHILNFLSSKDLFELGPVCISLNECRITVLKTRGFAWPSHQKLSPSLKLAKRLQKAAAIAKCTSGNPVGFVERTWRWFSKKNQNSMDEDSMLQKLMPRVIDLPLPAIDIHEMRVHSGNLEIPKEFLMEKGLSLAQGIDKAGRRFLTLHVRNRKNESHSSVITLLQRWTKGNIDEWTVSEKDEILKKTYDANQLTVAQAKKIAAIILGADPDFELYPNNFKTKF